MPGLEELKLSSWNRHKKNIIPMELPMQKQMQDEDIEYECNNIKVVLIFPDESPQDDCIKKEVREILVSALQEQFTS